MTQKEQYLQPLSHDTCCFPQCTCPVWCGPSSVQSEVKWSIAVIREARCPDQSIDPTAPQRHGEYNCTNSYRLHAWLQVSGAWGGQTLWGSHSIGRIDLLYSGQVWAANPNAPSIRAHRGWMRRELRTHGRGGSIHFCHACSHSSACICHKL